MKNLFLMFPAQLSKHKYKILMLFSYSLKYMCKTVIWEISNILLFGEKEKFLLHNLSKSFNNRKKMQQLF